MIQYLDIKLMNACFEEEFKNWFNNFLHGGQYILGRAVSDFESEFANYCGGLYCIGVGNGLDALRLIFEGYKILNKLQEGDKVLLAANSFIATVLAIEQAGLEPVFVEAENRYFNYDLDALKKTGLNGVKAIMVTHLYGQIGPMDDLWGFCRSHDLILIEDCAQAHGAILNDKKAGSLGQAAAFSFYPTKNLGALGDAGAVVTSDASLAAAIKKLRNYGTISKYVNELIGFNSRLDPLQAGFLSIKLKRLDANNERRREIAMDYLTKIKNPKLLLPAFKNGKNHVFHIFVVQVEARDRFVEFLGKAYVGTLIHYPTPPHKQQALGKYNHLSFPITEKMADSLVSLPLHPCMTDADVVAVITAVNSF